MRLGRTMVAVACAALVGAAPAGATPPDNGANGNRCVKQKQLKRFVCALSDGTIVIARCPIRYEAVSFTVMPDADVNDNGVICYANGFRARDDLP